MSAPKPYHCDLCGEELIELQGHDFWKGVCLNHQPPRIGYWPWMNPHHYESRALHPFEADALAAKQKKEEEQKEK